MPTSTPAAALDLDRLAAARRGDDRAFQLLVEPHRAALLAHCYRMLGSVQDAEDAVQDALLRSWRSLPRFEGRSSVKTWLYTIATNVCLRLIERRPRRVLPVDHSPAADPAHELAAPLVESVWVEPFPDHLLEPVDQADGPAARYEQRESIELAFVAALQLLPARQRAVLILRDVLGFSGAEVAEALGVTTTSVYSALQRAHRTIDDRLPEHSQQATLRALGDDRVRAIVEQYVAAWERRDVDALVAMLTGDATVTMPPRPSWFRGHRDVAAFLRRHPLAPGNGWSLVATGANGQVALLCKALHAAEAGAPAHHVLSLLTLTGDGRIADTTSYLDVATQEAGPA